MSVQRLVYGGRVTGRSPFMRVTDVGKSALFMSRQNVTPVSGEPADVIGNNLKLLFVCSVQLIWRRIRALSENLLTSECNI